MTVLEVARDTRQDRAERSAARMNDAAFPGQRYAVETLDTSLFAIVLHDAQAMSDAPMLTYRRDRRPRFTGQDFTAIAQSRSYKSQRGSYRTFA